MLHITPAERAVLQLLVDGRSTHEIAHRLRLDEADVNLRLKALFTRMGRSIHAEATAADCCRGSVILDRKGLSPSIEEHAESLEGNC